MTDERPGAVTEGLAPLPLSFWRGMMREQAATRAGTRRGVFRAGRERCRGCGIGLTGLYAVVGLAPDKTGYLCKGCFEIAYGDAT